MINKNITKQYIMHQLIEQTNILKLYAYNEKNSPFPHRHIFTQIKDHITNFTTKHTEPRWLIIPGLRGIGKTTILAQLFFHFQNTFGNKILYISIDDIINKLGSNLYEILDTYEELLEQSFSTLKEPVLLLIDEVHYDEKWQFALKSLYDKSKRIFIIATGSSAIPLNITTDVARRALIEKMYPLKFTEYIMLTTDSSKKFFSPDLSKKISDILFLSNTAKDVYSRLKNIETDIINFWSNVDSSSIIKYLKYHSLPSVLRINDPTKIYQILTNVIERIITKDIPTLKMFNRDILEKIQILLLMIAGSDEISFHNLTKNIGNINIKTVISILEVLEKSEMLLRIYPTGSIYKKTRKSSKYLFLASSLRAALLNIVDSRTIDLEYKGKLLEDAIAMYLTYETKKDINKSLTYDASKNSSDFVFEIANKKIVIEVGWNKTSDIQIINTMNRIKTNYGLLITNSILNLNNTNNIATIPLEYFLLL